MSELCVVTADTMAEMANLSAEMVSAALKEGFNVEVLPLERHVAVYRLTPIENDEAAPASHEG